MYAAQPTPAPTPNDDEHAMTDARPALPSTGLSEGAVFASLEARRRGDMPWRTGRTFAYVYDAGRRAEEVGKKAYASYLTENGLDPTAFPSLLSLETEVVGIVARHLNGPEGMVGSFTSGGTESILCAMKSARDWARIHKPEAKRPAIMLPTTAHAAFHKAAHYFGLDKQMVPVDPVTFKAVPEAMEAAITENTILMVGSTPSYAHGVIDPIEPLGEIALRHNLLLHVDACVGGWLLPYWKRLGETVPNFDLSVPGVTSLSVDLHKYAFCPKGASLVLYPKAELRNHQIYACADWTGYTVVNPTVQSSKTGGPLAAAWAVLNHLGDDGYLEIARATLEATLRLADAIEGMDGLRLLGTPEFSMVTVAATEDGPSVFHLVDEMKLRGWHLQAQLAYDNSPENLHFSLHPGNAPKVDGMVEALAEAVEASRALPSGQEMAAMVAQMFSGDVAVSAEMMDNLLGMAGVAGVDLPERMAEINTVLNALPVKAREMLLTGFINKLYR